MALPRVTDADVKQILATAMDTLPFIQTAHLLTDLYLSAAGYSLEHLAEIERWWAAHLCCIQEPRLVSRTLSDTREEFARWPEGEGLAGTPYGRQVLILDTKAILTEQGLIGEVVAPKSASFYVD